MPSNAETTWFITGCSTGLGRALASRVLEHGHRAVVSARDAKQVQDIVAAHPKRSVAAALDVTNARQVTEAVAYAERAFGGIDVLVNNAGYGYLAAVEEGEDHEVRAMFEANFFGLAALIRRALPGMRARGRGHIINISSVGGLIGNPSAGYYSATKFAVEGLSEALAKEVEPLGIRVTVIEPGPFRTDWAGRSLKQPRHPIEAYANTSGARRAVITGRSGKQPGDPVRAADAIIKVVESPAPPLNLILGRDGLDRVRVKLKDLMNSIDQWEAVTLSADFPKQ
jgi:NAD(P)-dependent dehydrogenase (short-subunit alcohol dehydrogenase family)